MKPRICVSILFVSLFLLTPSVFSGTWTRSTSNNTFYLSGSTTSRQACHARPSWESPGCLTPARIRISQVKRSQAERDDDAAE